MDLFSTAITDITGSSEHFKQHVTQFIYKNAR